MSGGAPLPARLAFLCPACSAPVEARDLGPSCGHCGARIELAAGGGFERGAALSRCAVCGSEALYRARDFNKKLGAAVVALGCLGFWWGLVPGLAALAALTLADRVVERLRPEVTVCYACKSVYRGLPLDAERLRPYELTYDETFEGTGGSPRFEPGPLRSPAPGPGA